MFNDPLALTLACLAGTFGGGLLGLWLRARVLRHHVDSNVEESVKLGVGMVATMTALLLGLIMASAKSNFDSVDLAVREAATRIITVDRALADLGEAALPARQAWHEAVNRLVDGIVDPQSATPDSPLVRPESLRLMDRAADLAVRQESRFWMPPGPFLSRHPWGLPPAEHRPCAGPAIPTARGRHNRLNTDNALIPSPRAHR